MADKTEYVPVSDNTASYDEAVYKIQMKQQRKLKTAIVSFLVGFLAMGTLVAVSWIAVSSKMPPAMRILPQAQNGSDPKTGLPLAWSNGDCGNSPEDAKARGCKYSIVLHSWLPASCLTPADEEDAIAMYKDRQWAYKTAAGQNLTMEGLEAGDYWYFTTSFDWHVTHCMYVWKRLHRIMLDPSQELDSYTANYHHTSHCVEMIGGNPGGMKDSGTTIFVKYPKCAK